MIKSIKELLYNGNYNDAITEIKRLLVDDNENSDLWYLLFLAENGDYFTTNFSRGYSNELSFNKALENSNRRKSAEFISEYNFYKSISKFANLGKLFRYAQYGNIKKVYDLIDTFDVDEFYISLEDSKDFYSNLDYIVYTSIGDNELDLSMLLVNLLYIKVQSKECLDILEDAIKKAEKSNTFLSPYSILKDEEKIVNALDALYKNSISNDNTGVNLDKLLLRAKVFLENKEFEKANELIEKVLNEDLANPYANLLKFMHDNNFSNEEEILDIRGGDISSNIYIKTALDNADGVLFERLNTYVDASIKNIDYYKGIHNFKRHNNLKALEYFQKIVGYKDSDEYIEKIASNIYDTAIELWNLHNYESAISKLNTILFYKDSKELIDKIKNSEQENTKKQIAEERRQERIANKGHKSATVVLRIINIYTILISIFLLIPIMFYNCVIVGNMGYSDGFNEFIINTYELITDSSGYIQFTTILLVQIILISIASGFSKKLKSFPKLTKSITSYLPFIVFVFFVYKTFANPIEKYEIWYNNIPLFLVIVCIITSIINKKFSLMPLLLAGIILYYGKAYSYLIEVSDVSKFKIILFNVLPFIIIMLIKLIFLKKSYDNRYQLSYFFAIFTILMMIYRFTDLTSYLFQFNMIEEILLDIIALTIIMDRGTPQYNSHAKSYIVLNTLRVINFIALGLAILIDNDNASNIYEVFYLDRNILLLYFYMLIPFVITFIILKRSNSLYKSKLKKLLMTFIILFIILTAIKFFASCNDTFMVESCTGINSSDGNNWLHIILIILYIEATAALSGSGSILIQPFIEGVIEGIKSQKST